MTFTYTNPSQTKEVWVGDVCIKPGKNLVKSERSASFEQAVKNGSLTVAVSGSPVKPESGLTVLFARNDHGVVCQSIRNIQKGSTITLPVPEDADGLTFGGWYKDVNCTEEFEESDTVEENMTLYPLWVEEEVVSYSVVHKQEALDGTFEVFETETLEGIVGKETEAAAKVYPGFTAGDVTQVEIEETGTEVVIQYTRNTIIATFDLAGGTTETVLEEGNTLSGKFGAELSIEDPTLEGHTFSAWTPEVPETFPAENATYVASYTETTE